jgi:hypothetical protein
METDSSQNIEPPNTYHQAEQNPPFPIFVKRGMERFESVFLKYPALNSYVA